MLLESSLILISILSGRLVRNKTRKEVKQWKKLLLIIPLASLFTALALIIFQNPSNSVLTALTGFALGFIFSNAVTFFAALGFFMASKLDFATSALFTLYFIVKGSLSSGSVLKELLPPVFALCVFTIIFYTNPSQTLVFAALFCGAALGGELAYAVKSKS